MFLYNFDVVYSTFLQVLTLMSFSFIISFVTQDRLQKSLTFFFTPQKIHHHHRSTYCIAGFLHQCIYTLQYIPEDDNFCLVCIQNQSLTQLLHCNACYTEHLNHENLSLCVLSTFSTYHSRTCFPFLSVLLPFFQITVTQPHSKFEMTLYRQSFYRIVAHHN